jgi:hypothetical protein
MAYFPPAALDHFARSHGIASLDQLMGLGMTRHCVHAMLHARNLVPVLKGVYRMPAVPFDERARCAAVCAAHLDATISGPTAGRIWAFRKLPRDRRIHMIARPHSQPTVATWVVPYRTAAIRPEDIVDLGDGIRLTSRARTALDLSRTLKDAALLSVIEQAARDGGLTDAELRAVAVDFMSPRRPWLRRYLLQVSARLRGGAADSHPETVLGDALLRAGIAGLERQYAIELPGYGPVRFDLAVPSLAWAIEVDVYPTHFETEGRRSDERRDRAARAIGWTVTRLTPSHLGGELPSSVSWLRRVHRDLRRAA